MISKKDLADRIEGFFNAMQKQTNRLESKIYELLESKIYELESQNRQLQKQLQCAVRGHNFVFEKLKFKYYQFKCSNCNLTITKTKDELTTKEKKALKDLGILESIKRFRNVGEK